MNNTEISQETKQQKTRQQSVQSICCFLPRDEKIPISHTLVENSNPFILFYVIVKLWWWCNTIPLAMEQ